MNKIEQKYLEIIKSQYDLELYNQLRFIQNKSEALASKSAEITEQIAIEFAIWLNKTDEIIKNTKHIDFSKSDEDVAKELFNIFIKTKDNV
jgi:hypothetical protein